MNASKVIQKYNPYEIAKANKIVVILEPLGKIHGYYNKAHGQKFIHIFPFQMPVQDVIKMPGTILITQTRCAARLFRF